MGGCGGWGGGKRGELGEGMGVVAADHEKQQGPGHLSVNDTEL